MYLLVFLAVLTVVYSAPANYDQRQDGKLNVHAKLENLVLVVAPSSSSVGGSLDFEFPGILDQDLNFRKSIHADKTEEKPEALNSERDQDPGSFEEISKDHGFKKDELTLIGDAIENCGPGRYRDGLGICRANENSKI